MFRVNDKVKIRPESWKQFLANSDREYYPLTAELFIRDVSINFHGPNTYSLAGVPFVWWEEDELIATQTKLQEVKSIKTKSRRVRVGDILHCSCKYEVQRLAPVWDQDGNHLDNDSNNTFDWKLLRSCICPMHGNK